MGLFGNRREGGLVDEIRCDKTSYLIWKWHPAGQADSTTKETSIRWGSSLHVKDGSVAVFMNAANEGSRDFIEGPYDGILETKNLPVLASIIGHAYDGGSPFPAEVYFINLAQIIQVKFGVPYFDVFDPRYYEFGVPVAVRGSITFRIANYYEFIQLHGLNHFALRDFQRQIRSAVTRYTKGVVANAPAMNDIPVAQIESRILEINDIVEFAIRNRLERDFGVLVTGVDIEAVEIDKESDGYKKLMEITRDATASRIRAEVKSDTKSKKGANGMGGFNPMSFIAGLAAGSGEAIKSAPGRQGNAAPSTVHPPENQTPPPIPEMQYHVAVDGIPVGPFSRDELLKLACIGQFSSQDLVWTKGMLDWHRAEAVPELADLFVSEGETPPPVPQTGA